MLVVAAALLDAQGRVLLSQRPPGKQLAGLWEFPGGKVEPIESPEAALVRELHEELGLEVDAQALTPLAFASHGYETFHLLMPLYRVHAWRGSPVAKEGQALAWVERADLRRYPMPPADLPLLPTLESLNLD